MVLAQVEFACDNYVNRSTRKTPLKIATRMQPRGISILRDIVGEEERSDEQEVFVHIMKYLHEKLKLRLEQSNQKYKENTDKARRHCVFEVGDEVMVHLKKGIFSIGMYTIS